MFKGLARSPFQPKSPNTAAMPAVPTMAPHQAVPDIAPASPPPVGTPPPGSPPPPEPVARSRDTAKEVDPAIQKHQSMKRRIHGQLVERLDMNRVNEIDPTTLRAEVRSVVEHLCDTEDPLLNRAERGKLVEEILDETFGLGPLEFLLKDDKIGDIMINGPKV